MDILNNPSRDTWDALTERNIPNDAAIEESVREIVATVKAQGDEALRTYARKFDGTEITEIEISEAERQAATAKVAENVKRAIATAAKNIAAFHAAQRPVPVEVETAKGVCCYQRAVPIQRVGLYIPGGQAPLFSTVLMLGLPARIAGCKEVVLCTPQGHDGEVAPAIIYAANVCGITHIYRVGGAQAIAAMAYGTESIRRVDKIFGPGNRFVTKAKQIVSQTTAIDMPAGPSEVLVMADSSAILAFVAADMLSQAEHGRDSQAMLVCSSVEIAERVKTEIARQMQLLHRPDALEHSLSHSRLLVFNDTQTMIDFANAYAAEHLIISMERPWEVAQKITAAGSVFIGNYSPESAGDYASGTNHTLPTSGWARSFSGVNLDSFQRKITYQELTAEGLKGLSETIISMADAEGLDAHAAAVKVRTGMI